MKNNHEYYDPRYDLRFRRIITLNATSTESMFLSLYDIISYENKYVTDVDYVETICIPEYGHMAGQIICRSQYKDICRSKNFLELVGKYKNTQRYYVMANITTTSTVFKIDYNDLDTVLKDNYISEMYRSKKYKLFLIKHIR